MLDNHWYILGAGAIGSLFACKFQQSNIPSTLLVRSRSLSPSDTAKHITYTAIDGNTHNILVKQQSTQASTPPIHQLLLTTKAHQSQQAISDIQPRLAKGAIVVIMQNGMGVLEELQCQLPHCQLIIATTTEGANRPFANAVVHAGAGETWIGSHTTIGQSAEIAQAIVLQWQSAGLSIHYDQEIMLRLWTKLAINCAINPLTVKYRCNNGSLLINDEALGLMQKVCDELTHVMAAKNLHPPADLFTIAKQVAQNTANNISSMLQDYKNKRPTEIQYINGYIVETGKALGIPTPTNLLLMRDIENSSYQNN